MKTKRIFMLFLALSMLLFSLMPAHSAAAEAEAEAGSFAEDAALAAEGEPIAPEEAFPELDIEEGTAAADEGETALPQEEDGLAGGDEAAQGIYPAAEEGEAAYASIEGATVSIGNMYIKRNFTVADGKIATTSIDNIRSGYTLVPGPGSEDFIIAVTDRFEMNVDSTIPERQIRTSDLTLAGTPAITNGDGMSHVVFTFQPAVRFGIPWTVVYTIEMVDGNHYMNSWLEIGVPEANRGGAYLHTVDVDAFNIGQDIPDELLWCRKDPQQEQVYNQFISSFQQSSGQPLYVNGLFFGIEFQVTSNDILPYPNAAGAGRDKNLLMRYYSGKSYERLASENRLNGSGRFVTWPAVVGAARSGEYEVIQDDFYSYVNDISQGTYFRTQFNTWYDGGMNITPASLTTSYMSIEQGLTQAGLPPINAYITDDGYNDYSGPFWGFKPSFANNVLKEISQMVTDAGGAFAKWISPRGGYGQTQSPFMAAAGTGFRSVSRYVEPTTPGGSPTVTYRGEICAASPTYIANLYDMFTFNMDEYNVNYWKLDGMARSICVDPRHGHMVGGIVAGSRSTRSVDSEAEGNDTDASSMWTFTELWENYNATFLNMRAHQAANGKGLWLNSTGTSVPSPWYLKIVNSIKVITSPDSGKTGATQFPDGSAVGDGARRLSFRDSGYWRFFNYNQYQFPFSYIWNHDPIYALGNSYVEMTAEDLRENLYGNAMRGNRVWELLFSPSVFTDAHWLITNETINFAKDNMDILGNVRMITDSRYNNGVMGQTNNDTGMTPYMMSAWGEQEGFVSFRNSRVGESVTLSLKLDRLAGVRDGMHGLSMAYVLPSEADPGNVLDRKATYDYGDTISVALGPMQFVIVHFYEDKDEAPPAIVRTEAMDANTLRVTFSEAIELAGGALPSVAGHAVVGTSLTADARSVDIAVSNAFADNEAISFANLGVRDLSANTATVSGAARYAAGRLVSQFASAADLLPGASVSYSGLLQSDVLSLAGNATGFSSGVSADLTNKLSISSLIRTASSDATVLEQAGAYSVKVNAEGKIEFTVGSITVQSKQAVNDGAWHHFACVKEPNEMTKVYIDGKISASSYYGYNLNILQAGAVAIGSAAFAGEISQLKVFNSSLGYMKVGELASQPLAEYDLAGYNAFAIAGMETRLPATVQARYDSTGYYNQTGSMPGASAQARFENVSYFRNYDAAWSALAGNANVPGKVAISGVLPGFDGDRAVSGNLSVLPEWPASWTLMGASLADVLDDMKAGGWEIIGENDSRLAVAANGLTITASRNKVDRGNIDVYDPEGLRILDGSPNPNYDPDADPNDVNYTNSQREFLDNVQNENFFVIDPGLDDYCISVDMNGNPNQLNKSAGLIIRQDDDNYVRMTYRVSGCTGNSTRPAMSLNVHVGGTELTLEESPGSMTAYYLALDKKGNYYTGYYSTNGTVWYKVGTVKAEMDSPKAGFYAALGVQSLPEHGFTSSAWAPRFSNFRIRQYSIGLSIDPQTHAAVDVELNDPSPRYAWADTVFSDGSKGSVLIEGLPEVDTSALGTVTAQGTVAGDPSVVVPVTINVVPEATAIGVSVAEKTDCGDKAEYTFSSAKMKDVNLIELTFEADCAILDVPAASIQGLNGFSVFNPAGQDIAWVDVGGGKWQGKAILAIAQGTSSGAMELAKLAFSALKLGDADLVLTGLKAYGIDIVDGAPRTSARPCRIIEPALARTNVYSIYNVNGDDAVDLEDLSLAFYFYMSTPASPDWEYAKVCDVNGDGRVDMGDLIEIYAHFFP